MEKIKHELHLLPMVVGTKSKLREDGSGAIKIRITLNCKEEDLFISTNAKPENWLPKEKQVSKNEKNHKQINEKLKAVETDLKRIYDRLYQRKPAVEPPKKEKEKEKLTLMQAFDEFIKKFGKLVKAKKRSDGTL